MPAALISFKQRVVCINDLTATCTHANDTGSYLTIQGSCLHSEDFYRYSIVSNTEKHKDLVFELQDK